jgi:transcriptional regulator with XRE-family HTH domain
VKTTIKTPDDLLAVMESAREEQGIALSRLARNCNMGHATYWSWARGGMMPKLDTLLRYATELGLKITVER